MSSSIILYQNYTMTQKTIFDPKYKAMIETLKLIRKKRGLTQRDLAKKLGVAHCFVGRAETCERRLDIIDLIRILKAFGFAKKQILKFLEKLI